MMRMVAMWLLPYYAGARLPTPLRKWMRHKLQSDSMLAAHYATLRRVERQAAQHEGLSEAQRNLIQANLFDALDDVKEAEKAAPGETIQSKASRPWGLAFSAVGLALVALVALEVSPDGASQAVLPGDNAPGRNDDFQMRSASGLPFGGDQSALGMRIRCLAGNAIVSDAVVGARQAEQRLDCQPDGLLAFSGTNLSGEARYVFAVGLGDNARITWIPPFTQQSEAVLLRAQSVDEVLSRLTPMSALEEDVATLLVVFSDKPFSGKRLSRQLGQLQRSALPLSRMDRLPLDYPVQARVRVRKLP